MMKLSSLAIACALAPAATAWAQSGVVLSGVADLAARSVHNAGSGSAKSLVSGSNSTSRLVIRGSEDMGGGLMAGFWLETGIAMDTGTSASSSQFFDRRSTVSVSDARLGELRLGRDYVPSYQAWVRHDPFSHVGVAGSNNLAGSGQTGPIRAAFASNPNTTVRANNTVQWLLPSGLGGVEGGLMLATDEGGTAANGQAKLSGLRLGWSSGAYGITVATTRSRNDITGADSFRDTVLGGQAGFGPLKLTLARREFKQASARQTNLMVGAVVVVGLGEIKASYLRANMSGRVGTRAIDANDATQIGLGYVHNLSRRTALYGTVSRIDNDGAATFAIPGGLALAAGRSSTGYEAGIRHTF